MYEDGMRKPTESVGKWKGVGKEGGIEGMILIKMQCIHV
jgi:hypothetical protein